jgi:hypothetical protein
MAPVTHTTTPTTPQLKRGVGGPRKYDRAAVAQHVCAELKAGRSLESICKDGGMPHVATFLDWVSEDPSGSGKDYAHAREIGYALLAEEIIKLSDKTGEWVEVHKTDSDGRPLFDKAGQPIMDRVHVPLSADVIAHKRLQIDTRKWMLSKMLPKVYGDKLTQEHTGAGGGPIALAAVDLKGLSDDELQRMQVLLSKAAAGGSSPP